MKAILKSLKLLGVLALLGIIAILGGLMHETREQNNKKQAELEYHAVTPWKWHDEFHRIQIMTAEPDGRSALRKVDLTNSTIVYAVKDDDYTLTTWVRFVVSCEPNTKIETSKKYSDGSPIVLSCNDDGDALTYFTGWGDKNPKFEWKENIDGFKFSVDFQQWDFTKLDREITLSKAK